eukprot:11950903-Ditylum_brightwellii.AAC.1
MLWEGDVYGGGSKEVARRILVIGIRNDRMAEHSGAKRPRPLRLSGRVEMTYAWYGRCGSPVRALSTLFVVVEMVRVNGDCQLKALLVVMVSDENTSAARKK